MEVVKVQQSCPRRAKFQEVRPLGPSPHCSHPTHPHLEKRVASLLRQDKEKLGGWAGAWLTPGKNQSLYPSVSASLSYSYLLSPECLPWISRRAKFCTGPPPESPRIAFSPFYQVGNQESERLSNLSEVTQQRRRLDVKSRAVK